VAVAPRVGERAEVVVAVGKDELTDTSWGGVSVLLAPKRGNAREETERSVW
jgi:hypothetical protein